MQKMKNYPSLKLSLFSNARNTPFDQSSPVQPNLEEKIWKNCEKKNLKNHFYFFKNPNLLKIFLSPKKNIFLLVLPIMEVSLRQEFSSPPSFTFQGRYGQTKFIRRSQEILVSNLGYLDEEKNKTFPKKLHKF